MADSPQRLVVVTGAAGALGQAVVAEFLAAGAAVAAVDIPGERLDALGATENVHAVGAQLSDATETVAAWSAIDAIGTPDTLVTLAGGFQPSSLADLTEDIWNAMIDSNVASVVWSAREAAKRFEAAGGGSIVTVGSKTAISGAAPLAHATSKAAVVRVTELLAEELRPKNIRVNTVLPSVIDTPANRTWMSEDLAARSVSPAAIAKVIAFLTSADAAPISGARVPVYGDA